MSLSVRRVDVENNFGNGNALITPTPRQVVKSELNHSIKSPRCLVWVRAPIGTETSPCFIAGVTCVFSRGSPVFAQPPDSPSYKSCNNLESDEQ